MKKDTHPSYNQQTAVKCACGNTFTTGSTKDDIYVEICSSCHPFYTGKQKLVDTARRVEKFQAKAQKTAVLKSKKKSAKTKKKANDKKTGTAASTLKDQLKKVKTNSDK